MKGPKGRHSVATSVRAWIKNSEGDPSAEDIAVQVSRREIVLVPALRASCEVDAIFHALTDVAIEYRPFGPETRDLRFLNR
jgi:hypothetical protein